MVVHWKPRIDILRLSRIQPQWANKCIPGWRAAVRQYLHLRPRDLGLRPDSSGDGACLREWACAEEVPILLAAEVSGQLLSPIVHAVLSEATPALPVRPASPLPPNVPTGPRNKNKYKDIDGSAPAVDGLDYGGGGGGMKEGGRGTPDDERNSRFVLMTADASALAHKMVTCRKRRSSPIGDEGRSSKRR